MQVWYILISSMDQRVRLPEGRKKGREEKWVGTRKVESRRRGERVEELGFWEKTTWTKKYQPDLLSPSLGSVASRT
jgi:hypothetical protein